MQIGLDLQLRSAAEARAVDLQILDHPLDVIAGLVDADLLDPARLEVAVDEAERFRAFLMELFDAIGRRDELASAPFDRRAAAESVFFQQQNPSTGPGSGKRRRNTGRPATDHENIGFEADLPPAIGRFQYPTPLLYGDILEKFRDACQLLLIYPYKLAFSLHRSVCALPAFQSLATLICYKDTAKQRSADAH